NDGPAQAVAFGTTSRVTLPSGQSYSSFVLLPLLNFAVRRRCLLVGGPGRGKTASAMLMGLLAGYSLRDIKRAIQHGQPQVTIAEAEVDRMNEEVRAVALPPPLRRRLEFFASQFEFCEPGGEQLEYKTKDTVKLAGVDLALLLGPEGGRDPLKDLGSQTRN